ncbi:MAG: FkbM family methyltransferase [Methanothermobacter sp.]|nr:FkbM family methyltransferase [Methanothermobacter sp.]
MVWRERSWFEEKVLLSKLGSEKSPIFWIYFLPKALIKLSKATNNPIGALIFLMGLSNGYDSNFNYSINVSFNKNDEQNKQLLRALVRLCSKTLNDKQRKNLLNIVSQRQNNIIQLDSLKLINSDVKYFILLEVFVDEEYCFKHLSDDALIIDVGAYVGDTALYFASKGYNVIAFEPISQFYNTAKKNLELNPKLSKKIKFINKGISGKKHKNYQIFR